MNTTPNIQAGNAFYYYADLQAAWAFYSDVLGFETLADFGFAKIMHLAKNSYLTLVEAGSGMHSVDEPKSVTMALVTEQVEGWYEYLKTSGVTIHKPLEVREGSTHDGFVALDPEGYYLEFERFNPHPENEALLPLLSTIEPLDTKSGARTPGLGVQATVLWLYYRSLMPGQQFYEDMLGTQLLVDQGWAKVYPIAGSAFLGLVDGAKGLHPSTRKKAVIVSFFTSDVDAWFERGAAYPYFELRTPEITQESGRVRLFVGYDPEGYYLEWDTFLDLPENQDLLRFLKEST